MEPDPAAGRQPPWEERWPGRLQREFDDLTAIGATFSVDRDRLRSGSLLLDVWWPSAEGIVHLQAAYPDSYPWMRPLVHLLDAPAGLPDRHYSPSDRQICLLGRDSRQWNCQWTLARLLVRQLGDALANSGVEDPQGEPAEFWWNCYARADDTGFCLVNSEWDPGHVDGGVLRVLYSLDKGRPSPTLRACVLEANASDGTFKASMAAPLAGLSDVMDVPWINLRETIVPGSSQEETGARIAAILAGRPDLASLRARRLHGHHRGRMVAISYPTEVAFGRQGTGWLFLLSIGKDPVRPGQRILMSVVRTMRAGAGDLAVRNPAAGALAGKRIAIVGVGAIGSPIALELARNGCRALELVDHDLVEPGNSIRWIAGQPAWGRGKADAVKEMIERHWPLCRVNATRHMIGGRDDQAMFDRILRGCDIVIDATASYGATLWLGSVCRSAGITLVSAMATADLECGVVAAFRPEGGCPRCLEHAWSLGDIPPFGAPEVELPIQPPGCSERTFEGGSYDLQEFSLQTVRTVLASLSRDDGSVVASARFYEGIGGVRSVSWRVDGLRQYEECGCRRHRA